MEFKTTTPTHENDILILVKNADTEYIVQGNYFFDDGGVYCDWDGEELYGVIGWAERPAITLK